MPSGIVEIPVTFSHSEYPGESGDSDVYDCEVEVLVLPRLKPSRLSHVYHFCSYTKTMPHPTQVGIPTWLPEVTEANVEASNIPTFVQLYEHHLDAWFAGCDKLGTEKPNQPLRNTDVLVLSETVEYQILLRGGLRNLQQATERVHTLVTWSPGILEPAGTRWEPLERRAREASDTTTEMNPRERPHLEHNYRYSQRCPKGLGSYIVGGNEVGYTGGYSEGIRVEKSIAGGKSEIRREGRRVMCDRAGEGAMSYGWFATRFLGHKPGPLLQFPGSPIYNEFISDHPLRDMTNSRRRHSTQNKPRKIKSREDAAVSARTLRYRKRVQAAINRDSKVGSETKKTMVLPLGNRSWLGANAYDNFTEVSNIWKMACNVRVWDFFMHSTSANSDGESRVSPFPLVPAKVLSEIFPSEVGVISWKGTPVDPLRRAAWAVKIGLT
ncbi:hypothetical protein B0H14DRAFT_3160815 [Mycena olivaceomarginata]|nr:hypothetical protein B0H14DRAFT_3160815 [Mycena olivaceomarginata]